MSHQRKLDKFRSLQHYSLLSLNMMSLVQNFWYENMMPSLPTFLCRWIDNQNWIRQLPNWRHRVWICIESMSLRKLSNFGTQAAFRKYQPSELNSAFGNYQPRNPSSLRKLSTFGTQSAFGNYQPSNSTGSRKLWLSTFARSRSPHWQHHDGSYTHFRYKIPWRHFIVGYPESRVSAGPTGLSVLESCL